MESDTNVRPCYKQIDHQGELLHYFHCPAITDRISQLSQLSITPQHTCIKSPQNGIAAVIYQLQKLTLIDIMTMIISRMLATYCNLFKCSDLA